MTRDHPRMDAHLSPEEVDLFAQTEGGTARPVRVEEHLGRCARCRADVAFVRSLDAELASLPHSSPPADFATRVMERVRLPIPWHRRARAALKRRWLPLTAAAAGATASLGGMSYWLFARQGLTPGGLAGFVADGIRELTVRGFIAAGRVVYELGLVDRGSRLLEGVEPITALAAMAFLSVFAFTALLAMMRLTGPGTRHTLNPR